MLKTSIFLASSLAAMAVQAGQANILGLDHPTRIQDQYIVVFKDGSNGIATQGVATQAQQKAQVQSLANEMALNHRGQTLRAFSSVMKGAAMRMSEKDAANLASDPRVKYIEADRMVYPTVTWGLDRIDQNSLPLDNIYSPSFGSNGAGVHAYVIDTGINNTHNDFAGRVGNGVDIFPGNGAKDCNGHGTHVAGTVGSDEFGVAPGVTLHAVRVFDCTGGTANSNTLAAMDWVRNNHIKPAVTNMSLGGGFSQATNDGLTALVNSGVTVVVAAGNDNADACSKSPASAPAAITVGSTTSSDARSSFSNYGSCVDIFAPGSSITSTWFRNNNDTNTISGTSMASPHVAGAAARYLGSNSGASPSQVATALINNSVTGAISDVRSGSPNRLLHVGNNPGAVGGGSGGGGGASCNRNENASGSLTGTGDQDFHPNGNYWYSSSGDSTGELVGTSGSNDFDLALWKWTGSWSVVRTSESSSSNELISYNGTSGYYVYRVHSYSGSGNYDFCLDR